MLLRLCSESALVCTINASGEQRVGLGTRGLWAVVMDLSLGGVFFMLPFRNKVRKANAANQLGQAPHPKYLSIEIRTHTIHVPQLL